MVSVRIPLTQNKFARVSIEDAERVMAFKWYAVKTEWTYYASATVNGHTVYMHRYLVGAPPDRQVDHIDHDGLHNWRSNLRLATQSQNNQNFRAARSDSSTKVRGVFPVGDKYRVRLWIDGKATSFGCYGTIEEAERVAKKRRAEFMPFSQEYREERE